MTTCSFLADSYLSLSTFPYPLQVRRLRLRNHCYDRHQRSHVVSTAASVGNFVGRRGCSMPLHRLRPRTHPAPRTPSSSSSPPSPLPPSPAASDSIPSR